MPGTLTILGSGSASPNLTRNPSAQVFRLDGTNILIDCGEGTQVQMLRRKVNFHSISLVLISHLHGDHYLGLFGWINTMNLQHRSGPLTVVSPPGLGELFGLHKKYAAFNPEFEISFLETQATGLEKVWENGTLSVEAFPLEHRIPCNGYLIREKEHLRKLNIDACRRFKIPVGFFRGIKSGEDYQVSPGRVIPNEKLTFDPQAPKSYAYCSDTLFSEKTASFVRGVDLLYHEATFLNNLVDVAQSTYHSTGLQAGMVARDAGVKRLVIGHFSSRYKNPNPILEEAKTVFPSCEIALEGSVFSL